MSNLEQRVEKLEQAVKELKGGKQPDSHINVWGAEGPPTPGSEQISDIIMEIKSRQKGKGMNSNEVQEFLDRGRDRTIEVMRELGRHPDLKYKSGKGRNPSRIMVPSIN